MELEHFGEPPDARRDPPPLILKEAHLTLDGGLRPGIAEGSSHHGGREAKSLPNGPELCAGHSSIDSHLALRRQYRAHWLSSLMGVSQPALLVNIGISEA